MKLNSGGAAERPAGRPAGARDGAAPLRWCPVAHFWTVSYLKKFLEFCYNFFKISYSP